MRVFRIILSAALAGQAGTLAAATASAPLPVSVTVPSVCVASSGSAGSGNQTAASRGGLARVTCSPAAAYGISVDKGWVDARLARGGQARASTLLSAPPERRGDVFVVEIAY